MGLVVASLLVAGMQAADFDHSHAEWTALLKENVSLDGAISRVDYGSVRRQRAPLDGYLRSLSSVSRTVFDSWTGDQQLAFLINAYNGFTMELIVDNYPVDSIKDLGGWMSSPWKKKFFVLLGRKRNLDDIEHGMIRKNFNEPRIHFAVNCASLGCPPLRSEAFVADRLDEQLEDNSRTFLNDARRNRFDAAANKLYLSSIFKWYGKDFVKKHGSVEAFVAPLLASAAASSQVASRSVRVAFLDYDWRLNDRK